MYNLESFKKYSVTPSTSRNPQKPPTSPHPPPAPRVPSSPSWIQPPGSLLQSFTLSFPLHSLIWLVWWEHKNCETQAAACPEQQQPRAASKDCPHVLGSFLLLDPRLGTSQGTGQFFQEGLPSVWAGPGFSSVFRWIKGRRVWAVFRPFGQLYLCNAFYNK